jgi:hypothetical protein
MAFVQLVGHKSPRIPATLGPDLPEVVEGHSFDIVPRGPQFRAMKNGLAAGELGPDS